MNDLPLSFAGSCHCGAIGFVFRTRLQPADWSVRACQCTFCQAHAARSWSDPAGKIEVVERQPSRLARYRFGQGTADFLICNRCGVYIGTVIDTAQGRFGVINVNAIRPIPPGIPEPQAMDYGGETPEQRTARRQRRWSPVIDVAEPSHR